MNTPKYLFFAFLLFVHSILGAQTITTIAGNRYSGFSGDGGSATLASLCQPWGVVLDECGNIYFADAYNNRIRKIDGSTGIISTLAGSATAGYGGDGGPATAALLRIPIDVILDRAGNIIFTDHNNNRIRKISLSGTISLFAGNGTNGFAGDGGAATAARLSLPDGIGIDPSGNILVADANNNRVRRIDTAGIITTIAGTGVDSSYGDGGPATAAGLDYPSDVAADKYGNIYISEYYGHRIRKINTSGIITTYAGMGGVGSSGDGGPATAARIHSATGIVVDANGNVFFSDAYNNRVRKIDINGIITIFAGTGIPGYSGDGGPATAANLNSPTGLALDNIGGVYVSDHRVNHAIRKIAGHNFMPILDSSYVYNTVCANTVHVFDTLKFIDSNRGQHIHVSLYSGPRHGTVSGLPIDIISNGGANIIDSIRYHATSFIGNDTFSVIIGDCLGYDTFQIYLNIIDAPTLWAITLPDSICIGDTTFSTIVSTGGHWLSSLNAISFDSSTGRVIGLRSGYDTISYIASNMCGADTASHRIFVNNCTLGLINEAEIMDVVITPNPSNGHFYLEGMKGPSTIKIFNSLGQIISNLSLDMNERERISLNVSPGVYYLVLTNNRTHVFKQFSIY